MKIQRKEAVKPVIVLEVEEMLNIVRPDISNNMNSFHSDTHHEYINGVVYDIVDSFATSNLILNYNLIKIAEFAKMTDNKIAKSITEIDYYDDIAIINEFDKLDMIRSVTRLYTKANNACIDKRRELHVKEMHKTDGVSVIESILVELIGQYSAYEVGVKKLIPHYKAEVDNKQTKAEIDLYINLTKTGKCIQFESCAAGSDFLNYCNKRGYLVDLNQSNSPDEILEIRNAVHNLYRDLTEKCDEKLIAYIAQEIEKESSDEDMLKLYKYFTIEQQQSDFLLKCLLDFKDNLSHYWFIYQELLDKFPKEIGSLILAKDKVIKSFLAKTTENDSFQVVYNIINNSIKGNVRDKVMARILKNETVKAIFIDRIGKATIYELLISASTFHFCDDKCIYRTIIKRFFSLNPTPQQISAFGSTIVSVAVSYSGMEEEFYDKINEFYARITDSEAPILTESELKAYFNVVKDNLACKNAKKAIIIAIYKQQHVN